MLISNFQPQAMPVAEVERHYSAAKVAELLDRCPEYVAKLAKAGAFGPCARDARGWLIPASGVSSWLRSITVSSSITGGVHR